MGLQVSTELRNNFNQLPIIVGILNGTTSEGRKQNVETAEEEEREDVAEIQPLHEFVVFLANSLNAKYVHLVE